MTDQAAEEQLRREVSGLSVEDILALCYHLQNKPERLRLYLDVLRRKGGTRAQFACCLLCFDLARQGDTGCQQEFLILADTMRELAQDTNVVQSLVGDDDYLSLIWEMCEAQLEELDPRLSIDIPVEVLTEEVATVNLFDDDDFVDFVFDVDDAKLQQEFARATDRFLGSIPGMPLYDPDAGFRMRNRSDTQRVEKYLSELDSYSQHVPLSRGFRTLLTLFYGTRLRSKGLFGGLNEKKQQLLRDGVRCFRDSGPETWEVAEVLIGAHATENAWPKVADMMLDFVSWMARRAENDADPENYDAIGRLMKRDTARKKNRHKY